MPFEMVHQHAELPDTFLRELEALEASYLRHDDPIEQSGFGGGRERWRAEREPILDAIEADGDLLDVGCANGYLLECLVQWGHERGIRLIPYGLDQGRRLVELARQRQPHLAANFFVGNAWDWQPPRLFDYVYTLLDCVPPDYAVEYVRRLLVRAVAPGGRLIVGSYGSRSREIPPTDVGAFLGSAGFAIVGTSQGGTPCIARFAWIVRERSTPMHQMPSV